MSRVFYSAEAGITAAALQEESQAAQAVAGCRAVVHRVDPDAPLDAAVRATYHLAKASVAAGVERFVLLSTQDLFDRHPVHWKVNAHWRPAPRPAEPHLRAWLTELSVREIVRQSSTRGYVLRLGQASDETVKAAIDDALTGEPRWPAFWLARHVGARPAAPPDSRPWREVLAPPAPIASRPIKNVVVFGASGPLAAPLYPLFADRFRFRLADIRPIADVVEKGYAHQPKGAPRPQVPAPPHEEVHCDVTDAAQVLDACRGMDAIVNCSVIRHTPRDFAVNLLGAVHMAQSAAACGIRRLVQTGPHQVINHDTESYFADWEIPGNAPERPGRASYAHSKFLGQEALRVFAAWYGMEVAVLLFNGFLTAESRGQLGFGTSFEDGARAIGRALEVEALPSPYEPMNICADVPLGLMSLERARTVLGWEPQDNFEDTWSE